MRIFKCNWIVLLTVVIELPALFGQQTVLQRFPAPDGYLRLELPNGHFGDWLRQLRVHPEGKRVLDYRGRIASRIRAESVAAVLDVDIRGRKLEQCMDILVRLRTEWLQFRQADSLIAFPLPDGKDLRWPDWRAGWRPTRVAFSWPISLTAQPDSSEASLQAYLRTIYYHSSTQTFYHKLPAVAIEEMMPGDLLIKKGSRGHAVLVLDIAESADGTRRALFAQGDTPACEMHILRHPEFGAWIPLDVHSAAPDLPIRKRMFWSGLRRFR